MRRHQPWFIFYASALLAVSVEARAQAPTVSTVPMPAATASPPAAVVASGGNAPPASVSICFSCHGADGNPISTDYPILKGQQRDYLVAALNAYRASQRTTTPNALVMSAMARGLTDAEIAEAADWFAMVRR